MTRDQVFEYRRRLREAADVIVADMHINPADVYINVDVRIDPSPQAIRITFVTTESP